MKTAAIIAEYNPFHNGHAYHIAKTRERADAVVCVMSGGAVQRGDFAVFDKFSRAEAAVSCGADLVVELPGAFACAAAERFARGAVEVLSALPAVNMLSFGCESAETAPLLACAEFMRFAADDRRIKKLQQQGAGFPAACFEVLNSVDPAAAQTLSSPNNLLAAQYLCFLPPHITPLPVERVGAPHDGAAASGGFASASYIRKLIAENKNWALYVPDASRAHIGADIENGRAGGGLLSLPQAVLYRLRTMTDAEYAAIPDGGCGLADRLKNAAASADSLDGLLAAAATKRYTSARIRRAVLCALLRIDGSFYERAPYIRVLAANGVGLTLLKGARLPVSHSLRTLSRAGEYESKHAALEARISDVRGLTLPNPESAASEYTRRFAPLG